MQFFTFSWGNNYIAIRGLLRVLGHELTTPTEASQEAIKKGVAVSDPFLCYSGKVVLGQIAEQLEAGHRNFVFMSSLSAEACRCADTAGYLRVLFESQYPDFRAVRLGGSSQGTSFTNMREYFPNVTLKMHDRAYYVFFVKLELLHMIEKTCLKLRSLAQNPDEVSALEKKYLALVDRHDYVAMLYWIGMRFTWAAKRIRRKKELPAVRIGIVGGEHILSELDSIMAKIKGIAERGIYLEWRSGFRFMARAFGSEPALKGNESLFYMKSLSKDYLHPAAMTSEIFSCAHALEFAEEGFDGILHVYAMGCMPQTALKPVLHKIAKDKHVPILALPLRDQFNEAGIETRLDAFIDLVEQNSINHTGGV